MSRLLTSVGFGLFAGIDGQKGRQPNALSGSPTAQPPPLDDEIRRLIGQHGWDAVAKSAKRLAKPNKRAEPEKEDWRALGPILTDEARRLLNGEPPRNRTAIAELAAPAARHKQSHASVITRLLRRQATAKAAMLRAVMKVEVAEAEFPCHVLIGACREAQKIKGAEFIAEIYLRQMTDAILAIEDAGDPVPETPTFKELIEAAAKSRTKRNSTAMMAALLGPSSLPADTN
jgi:hypothetical protein